MYKVLSEFLGFENLKELKIEKIDEYFSSLVLDDEGRIKINIVSIDFLTNTELNFELSDEILEKFKIKQADDCKIYFTLIMQNPIEESIVNLVAPIIINEKEKIIGQYVSNDTIFKVLKTLKDASTLV